MATRKSLAKYTIILLPRYLRAQVLKRGAISEKKRTPPHKSAECERRPQQHYEAQPRTSIDLRRTLQ